VCAFFRWCEQRKIWGLSEIRSHHVAGYVERLGRTHARPSVKQHLAAIRMLFDWLVVGQVVSHNPASTVRGPAYVVKKGKTPVLLGEEARALLDSLPTDTPVRLRDRAFISLLVYTFARVSAAVQMNAEDVFDMTQSSARRCTDVSGGVLNLKLEEGPQFFAHLHVI
jgi:site-specific recombinase XerD